MVVGVAVIEIHVESSQSLKAKRGVVRSIAGRVRNRFNVSVAEVGGQGTWQRATLGISMAGNDETATRRTLGRVVDFIEDTHLAQVLGSDVEVLRMPLDEAALGETDDDEEDWPWSDDDTDAAGRDD